MAASAVPIRSELQDARRILESADQYTWRKNDGSSPGQLFPKILPYSKLLGFTDEASFKKVYFSSVRRQLEINLNFALATSARGFADGAEREVGPHLMGWILQQAQSDPVITAARLAAIYGFNARQWKEPSRPIPIL